VKHPLTTRKRSGGSPIGDKDGDEGRLEDEVKDPTSQEDLKDLQEVEKDLVIHGRGRFLGFPG